MCAISCFLTRLSWCVLLGLYNLFKHHYGTFTHVCQGWLTGTLPCIWFLVYKHNGHRNYFAKWPQQSKTALNLRNSVINITVLPLILASKSFLTNKYDILLIIYIHIYGLWQSMMQQKKATVGHIVLYTMEMARESRKWFIDMLIMEFGSAKDTCVLIWTGSCCDIKKIILNNFILIIYLTQDMWVIILTTKIDSIQYYTLYLSDRVNWCKACEYIIMRRAPHLRENQNWIKSHRVLLIPCNISTYLTYCESYVLHGMWPIWYEIVILCKTTTLIALTSNTDIVLGLSY